MLKRLALKYWSVALLFICLVAVLCISRYAEDGGQGTKNTDHPPSWIETFEWPDGVTAWALVMTLLVVTWQSAEMSATTKATEKSVALAADTAKRQLRAYLCIDKSLVKFTEDGGLEGQLHLQNGGQTPAYDVMTWYCSMIREFPLAGPTIPPPANLPLSKGIIPPEGHRIIVTTKIPQKKLIWGDTGQMRSAFYVYGEACYKDIFGDIHTLEFRLFCGGLAEPRITVDDKGAKIGLLHMDTEGNREREGGLSFRSSNADATPRIAEKE